MTQSPHRQAKQKTKKSRSAWGHRQAKRAAFARGTVRHSEQSPGCNAAPTLFGARQAFNPLQNREPGGTAGSAPPRVTVRSGGLRPHARLGNSVHDSMPPKIFDERITCLHRMQNTIRL